MCLNKIRQRDDLPQMGTGYKEFQISEDHKIFFKVVKAQTKTDVWLKAADPGSYCHKYRMPATYGGQYECGFHIWINKRKKNFQLQLPAKKSLLSGNFLRHWDMSYSCTRDVLWRNPIVLGSQNQSCMVARELFIPSVKTLRKLRKKPGLLLDIFALPIGKKLGT